MPQETETSKKLLMFRENGYSKKNFIFQEMELSYTSGNGTFLYFGKGIFRNLVYLELEANSEPEHIRNHCHI